MFSFCAHLRRVVLLLFSLCCSWLPPSPSIDVRHVLFGFNSDKLCCVPRVLCYLLNVCKFFICLQRNDMLFRSIRPSAVKLLAAMHSFVSLFLPLLPNAFSLLCAVATLPINGEQMAQWASFVVTSLLFPFRLSWAPCFYCYTFGLFGSSLFVLCVSVFCLIFVPVSCLLSVKSFRLYGGEARFDSLTKLVSRPRMRLLPLPGSTF